MIIQPLSSGSPKPLNSSGRGIAPLVPITSPILERKPQQKSEPKVEQVTEKPKTKQSGGFIEGVKQFATRTAVSFGDLITEGLDFSTNFIANNPVFFTKLASGKPLDAISGLSKKKSDTEVKIVNKWKDIYNTSVEKGIVPTRNAKLSVDKIQQNDYIKPSEKWTKAPIKEKLTSQLGETLAVLGPSLIPSFFLYAINPIAGASVTVTSTANDIQQNAMKNGVPREKAELLGLGTGLLVGALDRIVPDELFNPSQKSKFVSGFVKRIVPTSLKEAGTEIAQEDIQIAAEATFRKDLGLDEIATRNIMSGLGGLLGGAGASTVMGTINQSFKNEILSDKVEEIKPVEEKKSTVIEPLYPATDNVVQVTETPVEGEVLAKAEEAPQPTPQVVTTESKPTTSTKPTESSILASKPEPISKQKIDTAKDIKDVQSSLKSIRSEYENLLTESEAKAVLAQDKRSGLDTQKIANLRRIYNKTKAFQEGDIEVIRQSKHGKLLNSVIENIQEKYPEMDEQEAFDFAMDLPTKAEEVFKKSPDIKELMKKEKVLKEYMQTLRDKQKELSLADSKELEAEWKSIMAQQEQLAKVIEMQRSLIPVGEGKIKASKLEARMKGALQNVDQETIDRLGLTTYNQMNKKENISKAAEYVSKNPEEALKVLTGEIEAPKGVLRNSVYVALENQASEDVDLARKMASITSTRLGQEISILSEANPNSPVTIMRDIVKIREATFKKRFSGKTVSEARKKIVSDIEAKVEAPKKSDWAKFIDSIKC